MLVPINWLDDYVDIKNEDIQTLENHLIMSGSNTEEVTNFSDRLENIVVGKIKKIEKHKDADKLLVMQVDVGKETLQIVTGAKNCSENDLVPVVLAGGKIFDGTVIKKGKLRGETSNGMLCSLQELGFNKSVVPEKYSDGIYILDDSFEVGQDFLKTVLDDNIVEFEITPNRPDCLSILGMAREASATFDKELNLPNTNIEDSIDFEESFEINIEDENKCRRYMAKIIKDVKIKESPTWLQMKLMKYGIRPQSNIVDITNYVLLEYGQPIHAFDLDTLKGNEINVRMAKKGEILKTLDGEDRKLTKDNIVICDESDPVALAGVMGGLDTEVTDDTKNILIEVANFDAKSIRETSKQFGLRSEASSRYEKGISPSLVKDAANRVCNLVESLNAGKVVEKEWDNYPNKVKEKEILVRKEKVNGLLGTDLSVKEMIDILDKLSIKCKKTNEGLIATPPLFRLDLKKEIDFVEEIARIYGYDQIDRTLPKSHTWGDRSYSQKIEKDVRNNLFTQGVSEITTYSFVSPDCFDDLRLKDENELRETVKLENPLGKEYSVMRTTLIDNMLQTLKSNYKRNIEKVKLFELGNVFIPNKDDAKSLPTEKKRLVLGTYGKGDFFDTKGILENIFLNLGLTDYRLKKQKENPIFHPGKCGEIFLGEDEKVGIIGQVHPKTIKNYEIDEDVFIFDLDFDLLIEKSNKKIKYEKITKYPSIERDIAVVVKDEITHQDVLDVINDNGGKYVQNIKLFDIYEGKQIKEGYKSMAYNIVFRAKDKTLKEEEISKNYQRIIDELENKLDAELRE